MAIECRHRAIEFTEHEFTEHKGTHAVDSTEHTPSAVDRVKTLLARVQGWRVMRVLRRFSGSNASILAAGMSYQSLFALFAAIWVGFSIAGLWLSGNPDLLSALVSIINQAVPGLIGSGSHGIVQVSQLTGGSTLSITGLIALASLFWTAVGWLSSTRQAIRTMFDLPQDATNFAIQKARDLGLAAGFGLLLIVAALVSLASTSVLTFLLQLVGVGRESLFSVIAARTVGIAFTFLLNAVVLAAMYRVLSRVAIPRRQLMHGAILGSVGLSVLSVASGSLIGGAGKNPLLGTFAVLLGLLIWLNLVWQVLLFAATWIAVEMADAEIPVQKLSQAQLQSEQQERVRAARIVVAHADLEAANTRLATVGAFGRIGARRDVDRATRTLRDLGAPTASEVDAAVAMADGETDTTSESTTAQTTGGEGVGGRR